MGPPVSLELQRAGMWISPEPGLLAGYLHRGDDRSELVAVVKYPPVTSTGLRRIHMKALNDPENLEGPVWPWGPPPSPARVEAMWDRLSAIYAGEDPDDIDPDEVGWAADPVKDNVSLRQAAPRATIENLTRRPGEKPDAFYRRVADAYLELAAVSDTPTKLIAEIAEVSQPAATSWVHRARRRRLLPAVCDVSEVGA